MDEDLICLIEKKKFELIKKGIYIDVIKCEDEFTEPATTVDLFNDVAYCRVTTTRSGRLYIQILNIETEDTIFFYDDYCCGVVDIEKFIMDNIWKMLDL